MKKLEAWFENGIDDDALTRICEILINHDAKFYVLDVEQSSEMEKGDPECSYFRGGNCVHPHSKSDACVLNNDFCSVFKVVMGRKGDSHG